MRLLLLFFWLIVFLLILLGITTIHAWYFTVNVVFYSAIIDSLIAAALTLTLSWLTGYLKTLNSLEGFQSLLIFILTGYIFAISVPTVIDRSLSFYILEKISQRGGGVKADAVEFIFKNEYIREHRLIDVRLTEQLESGTIYIDNGCVKLTHRGKNLAKFSRFYRTNLLPKKRLLMGKHTDALTDPFRDSDTSVNYNCN